MKLTILEGGRRRWILRGASLLLALLMMAAPASAQEFACGVKVDIRQLSGTRYTFLNELEQLIPQYLNRNTWTDERYLPFERIRCSMQILFEQALSLNSFRARLIITMERPIYGTTARTTVLRLNDEEWQFDYTQGTPLTFDVERFDAFTSVLDFYAYVMLGYDYDTFSELGGSEYFAKAQRIADLAQSQGGIGWSQVGSERNRTSLIRQVLDPRFQLVRQSYFTYHYGGLDHFVTRTDEARQSVLQALQNIETLYNSLSRQYVMDVFFDAKYQEIASIFEDSSLSQQVYAILSQVDPSHLSEYNRLVQ